MKGTVQITAFNTRVEADMAVARLADAGIKSFVMADNLGGTFPQMQMATGGFKVFVLNEDLERAKAVMTEHYPPIQSNPAADVSTFQKAVRSVSTPQARRIRIAVYGMAILITVLLIAWVGDGGIL